MGAGSATVRRRPRAPTPLRTVAEAWMLMHIALPERPPP
ncbi:MAG: hypothetical protein ACJA1L_002044, partial [Paracoccaceae bacterium]